MELYSGRKPLLTEKGLANTVILIMMARLSQSDTLLVRMDSGSWKEIMFPPELLVKSLPLLLPRPRHLLFLSKSLHSQLTMTMLIHQWILTSTHSSTPMTQLTVTSCSTEMEPTLDPIMPTTLLTVSQTVLTVLVLTLTNKLV